MNAGSYSSLCLILFSPYSFPLSALKPHLTQSPLFKLCPYSVFNGSKNAAFHLPCGGRNLKDQHNVILWSGRGVQGHLWSQSILPVLQPQASPLLFLLPWSLWALNGRNRGFTRNLGNRSRYDPAYCTIITLCSYHTSWGGAKGVWTEQIWAWSCIWVWTFEHPFNWTENRRKKKIRPRYYLLHYNNYLVLFPSLQPTNVKEISFYGHARKRVPPHQPLWSPLRV